MKLSAILISSAMGTLVMGNDVAAQSIESIVRDGATLALVCALTNSCGSQPRPPVRNPNPNKVHASETVRADQNALNYFQFPAGPADGYSGRQTRNAISNFQGFMGYPMTGQLTDWQRDQLMNYYYQASSGMPSQHGDVLRQRGPQGWLSAAVHGNRTPSPPLPPDPAPLPDPIPVANERSMAQHCASVDILTQANGRTISASSMTEPGQALNEQFCGARGYSMSRASQLAGNSDGMISDRARTECQQFVQTMRPVTENLGSASPQERIEAAESFAARTGAPQQQLRNIGEICLGVGYQTDDAQVSVAAAMLLIGSGERAYAEVLGHHLRNGFGTDENPRVAADWYGLGLDALEAGDNPAFLPSQSVERASVIRAALNGAPSISGATNMDFVLPNFN